MVGKKVWVAMREGWRTERWGETTETLGEGQIIR